MSSTRKPWEHAKGEAGGGGEGDPLAARFVSSLDYDRRLYRHDILGSLAHARMLKGVELITAGELEKIERSLEEIEAEIDERGDAWPGWKVELEDVHMCIEAALIEKAGDAGRKLHTGRSRNDQVATDLLLWVREATGEVVGAIGGVMSALVELADRDGGMVMPSYTHLQRAQPIVVGGELLAWVEAMSACSTRFEMLRALDRNPLGSGAIAGSSLPLDRRATTLALMGEDEEGVEKIDGFLQGMFGLSDDEMQEVVEGGPDADMSANAIHATASRDVAIDFAYALSMTGMWLSRWAEQWIIYASAEFKFITLGDQYTTGSSMMPQKQNPDMLELVRGKCGGVYGALMALLTMCKGLPLGYNRDLQEDKRHLFYAYDSVRDCLDMAAAMVRSARFNEANIKAGLRKGYLDATSLAEYLVTQGVAFRTAHQVVGKLVHLCESEGLGELGKLSVERINAAAADAGAGQKTVGEGVYDWLGPENVVQRYQTPGNAGLRGFEHQLQSWKDRLHNEDEPTHS